MNKKTIIGTITLSLLGISAIIFSCSSNTETEKVIYTITKKMTCNIPTAPANKALVREQQCSHKMVSFTLFKTSNNILRSSSAAVFPLPAFTTKKTVVPEHWTQFLKQTSQVWYLLDYGCKLQPPLGPISKDAHRCTDHFSY